MRRIRTKKDFDKKQEKLIEAMWHIFLTHGYEHTTLAVLIKELGISKGVFYHYFTSKEDCAECCAAQYARTCVLKLKESLDKKRPAHEQFMELIYGGSRQFSQNEMVQINSSVNQIFHEMLMIQLVKQLTPLYAEIITAGNEEGVYHVKYPVETAEMILTLCQFYLDKDFFNWQEDGMPQRTKAVRDMLYKALGIEDNALIEEAEKEL